MWYVFHFESFWSRFLLTSPTHIRFQLTCQYSYLNNDYPVVCLAESIVLFCQLLWYIKNLWYEQSNKNYFHSFHRILSFLYLKKLFILHVSTYLCKLSTMIPIILWYHWGIFHLIYWYFGSLDRESQTLNYVMTKNDLKSFPYLLYDI